MVSRISELLALPWISISNPYFSCLFLSILVLVLFLLFGTVSTSNKLPTGISSGHIFYHLPVVLHFLFTFPLSFYLLSLPLMSQLGSGLSSVTNQAVNKHILFISLISTWYSLFPKNIIHGSFSSSMVHSLLLYFSSKNIGFISSFVIVLSLSNRELWFTFLSLANISGSVDKRVSWK